MIGLSLLAGILAGQTQPGPPVVTLTRPDRVLPAEFIQVRGIRELSDGRVIISDRLDERIVVADFASGNLRVLGRTGGGPAEYRLPGALVAVAGDSTVFIDEGNGRLGLIGPDLRFHRTFTLRVPGVPTGLWPRAVDGRGRYYAQVARWAAEAIGIRSDSLPLLRVEPTSGKYDVVAWIHSPGQRLPSNHSPGPRIPYIPFASQDSWTVTPDGRIAVARSGDYHVEWIEPDGRRSSGSPVAWQRRPVTEADKMDYTRGFVANSGVGGKGGSDRPPGGLTAATPDMLTDAAVREMIGYSTFATHKPPFTDALPRIGPDGTVWLERSGARGEPSTWDGFDGRGVLIRRMVLPRGRRLMTLGTAGVYAVMTTADGIEKVERFRY